MRKVILICSLFFFFTANAQVKVFCYKETGQCISDAVIDVNASQDSIYRKLK
jgi:hypothetical protein